MKKERKSRMLSRQTIRLGSFALIAALLLVGCLLLMIGVVIEDSPAPGCIRYLGMAPIGGCFGKTAILDLTVAPQIECLAVTANNCNGGVIELQNNCVEPLYLDDVEIAPRQREILDVSHDQGQYSLYTTGWNFSEYVPQADEPLEFVGTLGNQEVRLTFTKTALLCQ
jgi:hypothetical protein